MFHGFDLSELFSFIVFVLVLYKNFSSLSASLEVNLKALFSFRFLSSSLVALATAISLNVFVHLVQVSRPEMTNRNYNTCWYKWSKQSNARKKIIKC